jgi:hypothetical protein
MRFDKVGVPAAKVFLLTQISLSAKDISHTFQSGVCYK